MRQLMRPRDFEEKSKKKPQQEILASQRQSYVSSTDNGMQKIQSTWVIVVLFSPTLLKKAFSLKKCFIQKHKLCSKEIWFYFFHGTQKFKFVLSYFRMIF